jgi:protein phosphatase
MRRVRRRDRDRERVPLRRRLSWRVVGFGLLLVVVIGGAFATIQWYGTGAYYVGFDGDEVVIYQGRPGGVLWIDPEVEQRTRIDKADVPPRTLGAVEDGSEQASLQDAKVFVANMRNDIEEATAATSTTTTTTLPVDPNASTTVVAP